MAIDSKKLFESLKKNDIGFFTGVPDSLLKDFCLCIDENVSSNNHIIAPNEGNAIALASGYYLATKKLPVVYMQNSGIGNAINPLLSLCDKEVYSIPIFLIIGWRGEPGIKDEPQHIKQGRIQLNLMKTLEIPFRIISSNDSEFIEKVDFLAKKAFNDNQPVALIVKKNTFKKFSKLKTTLNEDLLTREEALEVILKGLDDSSAVISTTGKTSREIFEIREKFNQSHKRDFLTVGSMGHCSSIALGIALQKSQKKVVCIDGDGAMLMHLGILTSIANSKITNFFHIVLNNEAHESVGGQETSAKKINLSDLVKNLNQEKTFYIKTKSELNKLLKKFNEEGGNYFIECKIKMGSRSNLGRPSKTPIENKESFMDFLND